MTIMQPTRIKDIVPYDLRKGMVLKRMDCQFTLIRICFFSHESILKQNSVDIMNDVWLESLISVDKIRPGLQGNGYILKFVDFQSGSNRHSRILNYSTTLYSTILLHVIVNSSDYIPDAAMHINPKNIWGRFGSREMGTGMIIRGRPGDHEVFLKSVYNSKISWPVKEYIGPLYTPGGKK